MTPLKAYWRWWFHMIPKNSQTNPGRWWIFRWFSMIFTCRVVPLSLKKPQALRSSPALQKRRCCWWGAVTSPCIEAFLEAECGTGSCEKLRCIVYISFTFFCCEYYHSFFQASRNFSTKFWMFSFVPPFLCAKNCNIWVDGLQILWRSEENIENKLGNHLLHPWIWKRSLAKTVGWCSAVCQRPTFAKDFFFCRGRSLFSGKSSIPGKQMLMKLQVLVTVISVSLAYFCGFLRFQIQTSPSQTPSRKLCQIDRWK